MTVKVRASRSYDIVIERGALSRVGELCRPVLPGRNILLLSDSNVAPLYADRAEESFARAGFRVTRYVVPAGEASKSAENLFAIVSFLADKGFTRADSVAALGGGVVGDLGGFCAATYQRGIGFAQIPTTLLACVDSSVGGKTAVNLPEGKNLFGAFYQPHIVVSDPDALATLPPEIYADGMAEAVKYGAIYDGEFFSLLEKGGAGDEEIIARSARIKSEIVGEDERESGLRKILNFGHTVGHAAERLSGYTLPHGRAVAAGMAVVTRALVNRGDGPRETLSRLEKLLARLDLPLTFPYSAEDLAGAARGDKKREGDSVTLVCVRNIGKAELVPLPVDGLAEFIAAGL